MVVIMVQGQGKSACEGIAIGRIYVYERSDTVLEISSGDSAIEWEIFHKAKQKALEELQVIYEQIYLEFGEKDASIMGMQQLMINDINFLESVEAYIQAGKSAGMAVQETGEILGKTFELLEDEYIKERASDIRDVAKRVVRIISGEEEQFAMEEPGIVVAKDLSPTETVALPKDKILAFVIQTGSSNSHTAILARMMHIPALIQANIVIEDSLNGKQIAVDTFRGTFYVEPDCNVVNKMQQNLQEWKQIVKELDVYRGRESITKSGKMIQVVANVGDLSDVEYAITEGAEGIGLMRSEFLYLSRSSFPTEEELFQVYKNIVSRMNGQKVVIRTWDIGADKQVGYFRLDNEENPALGYRGIRIYLKEPVIFRTQMRAIYRASAYGNVAVMFPMIINLLEVQEIKRFSRKILEELQEEGVEVKEVELGIMIETPAAVLISDSLAKEVDFFSVGTNDLIQYTLALDRQNEKLEYLYDPYHPAILMQLELIAQNARNAGIWAGVCGELAADLGMTESFIEMGYTELSVSPGQILKVRKQICESK